jgi:hypothetical protein
VQTIISELGVVMSRWNREENGASWLGLCPDNRVSRGKVLKRDIRRIVNRAAPLYGWQRGASYEVEYPRRQFRRLWSKLGAPKAITAMTHKLATLITAMLKFDCIDKGLEAYESKYCQWKMK